MDRATVEEIVHRARHVLESESTQTGPQRAAVLTLLHTGLAQVVDGESVWPMGGYLLSDEFDEAMLGVAMLRSTYWPDVDPFGGSDGMLNMLMQVTPAIVLSQLVCGNPGIDTWCLMASVEAYRPAPGLDDAEIEQANALLEGLEAGQHPSVLDPRFVTRQRGITVFTAQRNASEVEAFSVNLIGDRSDGFSEEDVSIVVAHALPSMNVSARAMKDAFGSDAVHRYPFAWMRDAPHDIVGDPMLRWVLSAKELWQGGAILFSPAPLLAETLIAEDLVDRATIDGWAEAPAGEE